MPLIPRRRYMMGYVDRCKVKVPQLMTETDLMNPPAIFFSSDIKKKPFLNMMSLEMRLGFCIKYASKTRFI